MMCAELLETKLSKDMTPRNLAIKLRKFITMLVVGDISLVVNCEAREQVENGTIVTMECVGVWGDTSQVSDCEVANMARTCIEPVIQLRKFITMLVVGDISLVVDCEAREQVENVTIVTMECVEVWSDINLVLDCEVVNKATTCIEPVDSKEGEQRENVMNAMVDSKAGVKREKGMNMVVEFMWVWGDIILVLDHEVARMVITSGKPRDERETVKDVEEQQEVVVRDKKKKVSLRDKKKKVNRTNTVVEVMWVWGDIILVLDHEVPMNARMVITSGKPRDERETVKDVEEQQEVVVRDKKKKASLRDKKKKVNRTRDEERTNVKK